VDTLDFVTASANLRSHIFGIETRSKFDIKQMAGNIIPAIASTNAIIAGMLVLQAIYVLWAEWSKARCVNLSRLSGRVCTIFPPQKPNPACGVCADAYVELGVDPHVVTLQQVLSDVVRAPLAAGGLAYGSGGDFDEDEETELAAYEGTRLLLDPDFDDNANKTLIELGLGLGKTLTVVDEDSKWASLNLLIGDLPVSAELGDRANKSWILRGRIPTIARKPEPVAKPADEDDDEDKDASEDDIVVVSAQTESLAGKRRTAAELEADDAAIGHESASKRPRTTADQNRATDNDPPAKRARRSEGAVVGSSADDAIELD